MTAFVCWAALALGYPTENVPIPPGPPVDLSMTDQFSRRASVANERGAVLVLFFGDAPAQRANEALRDRVFLYYHPTAVGRTGEQAAKAPVKPLVGMGGAAPDVRVRFAACVGKVPAQAKKMIALQFANTAPATSVWLDFDDALKQQFGVTPRAVNVAVFDAEGRLRMQLSGDVDEPAVSRLLRKIDALRVEAATPPAKK